MRVDGNRSGSSFRATLSSTSGSAPQKLPCIAAILQPAISEARPIVSLLLVWVLLLQVTAPTSAHFISEPGAVATGYSESRSSGPRVQSDHRNWLTRLAHGWATGAISSAASLSAAPRPVITSAAVTGIAVVRHAPQINGHGRVEGSLRQLTGENVTLDGGAVITEDLQVPGTPTVVLNGNPTFGGTIQGLGSPQPTNYQVILNGGSTVLGHLVTRTDPISLGNVPLPPAAPGIRSVTITAPGQSAGNFATLRDLTLNGNAGMFTVPPGSYRNFTANGGNGFVFGESGASKPSTYNLNALTLNGHSQLQIVGPVNLTLANGLTLNASMGSAANPAWLNLRVSSGDVVLNGGSSLYAIVTAPTGEILISGNAQLLGTVACDRLTVNGGGLLRLTESALPPVNQPPVNQPPVVSAGLNQTITLPSAAALSGSVTDDGLPAGSTLTSEWSQVSGPETVVFANAAVPVTTASFTHAGTYVLRLTAHDSELSAAAEVTIGVIESRVPPIADFVVPQSTGTAGAFVVAPAGSATVAQLLDSDVSTFWTTPNINNQFATFRFFDQELIFIDRVRLQSADGLVSNATLKDFDVQLSVTTADDSSFVAVFSGTLLNTGQLQEFIFPGGPDRARYIKLLLKNNYGSPNNIQLSTFNPVAVGSADNIISLPGQTNASLSQSPSLIANGAAIYDSTYRGGSTSPNGLLGYNNGGWAPSVSSNPYAIIQLAGDKVYTLSGIKMATAWDLGYGDTTAVKKFEVWVSATTPSTASFTKVLTATAAFSGHLQTFVFPGGPVSARYVKYVPLTNGGGPTINTQSFDVIAEEVAQVLSASGQNQDILNPAEAAFDSDAESIWFSPGNAITNVWAKTSLADGATQKVYGVRINPVNDFTYGQRGPKDFDISVSTTTTDVSAFTTVYSGTLANTFGGATQEFLFADLVDARYVQFFWKNGYSAANIGVRALEVLAAPTRGAALVGFSTQQEPAGNALDLDPRNQWVTAPNNFTNQWLKLLLSNGDLSTINHISLRPAIATNGNFSAPKDFELQVSRTDSADSSFAPIFAGTLANSTQLQDFYFAPAQARYVRLLLKDNYGGGRFGLASFYVYAADQIGSTSSFLDRSTDADGSVERWWWDFGDGATSSERNPTHNFAVPGDYTVSLTVTDNSGFTNTRQTTYRVLSSLRPHFSYSPIFSHEGGESVRFTDTNNLLAQPTALRQYDFGDGTAVSQIVGTSLHTFSESGTYHVSLKVGDPLGVSHATSKDIIVLNVPPAVDIPNGKILVWGEEWNSVPSISDQGAVDRLTLQGRWDFGDGQTSACVNCTNANATVTHAYTSPGSYTAVLAITDKDGGVGSDSATYVVAKRGTSLAFLANSLQGSGQTFLSRVRLTDLFATVGIPNRAIQFNFNGTTASATTDANGFAEISLPISSGTNVASITATWAGDNLYVPSNNTASTTLNLGPTVNAGEDQAITLPCAVSLSGSVTDDGVPAGVPLSLAWNKVSGPGDVSFADVNAALTTASFSASGSYTLRLIADDSQLTGSDDVTVNVNLLEAGTAQYFGPSPYLSFRDSPLTGRNASYFHLENFEDHLLNTPGIAASAGGSSSIVFGSELHDSVDADDGVIDGNGLAGDSYFSAAGSAGITFSFNAGVLGSLPTHAGLVWTDGAGQVFFEAFDHQGASLGVRGPYDFADGVNNGTTAEDNFLGAYNNQGISAIKIWNTVGGIEIDHLQYAFSTANHAPLVNAGPDQSVNLPAGGVLLSGIVSDDGLPACAAVQSTWVIVSGPGDVTFENSQQAVTRASFTNTGLYTLRLTASDSQLSSADDLNITVSDGLANRPPLVAAGPDQTITLPTNSVSLNAMVTDDGQPIGGTLTAVWNVLSGPGNVIFIDAAALATTATFSDAGTYLLRITASDSQLTASDEIVVIVKPPSANQPPTANAGPDHALALNANLIANGGNDNSLVNGEIPGWTEVQGATWMAGSANIADGFSEAQRGPAYFYSGNTAQAELRQDVDLTAYRASIAAGTQQFEFKVYLRSAAEASPDPGRVLLEYRDAANANVIATLDSGDIISSGGWHLTEDTHLAPVGTGWIRVRLIATRNTNAPPGASNDAYFDSVSLRPRGAAAVKLNGIVTDDGAPQGGDLTASWLALSGPGAVMFTTPDAPVTGASFTTAGTYVLRLTSSDGDAGASDEVTVIVNPANQAPLVNAGASQAITLPATADLNGTVTDDGQPSVSSLSILWSKVSGPGTVTFADSNQPTTRASFSAAGTYVLRLRADDTEFDTAADVTITINAEPAPVNQPPSVNAGPNQTISLPADTVTLSGSATDDGLPAGNIFTLTWTQISGSGVVTFGNATSAITTAQFPIAGSYLLRLTAGDGVLTSSADVTITVTPPAARNQAPTANAGSDQIIRLSQGAQLDGVAGDDGLPAGSSLTTTWTAVSGPGRVTFDNPEVTITRANFSASGTYVLSLTASDGELSVADDLIITVNDDVAPPTVEITAPADGSSVREPTIVTGSVSDGVWQLDYSLAGDDNLNNRSWTTFAHGNGAVLNGPLGTLDPTMMLNGLFTIRLSASDNYGQVSRTSIDVIVERNLKIGNFNLSFNDLNIPVAGVPLEVTRTYDSRDKRVGDFGFGWTLGLKNIRLEKSGVLGLKWFETVSQDVFRNYCLEAIGKHLVTVTFPGGKVFKFQAAVTPQCQRLTPITTGTLSFIPMPGTHAALEVMGLADFQVEGSIPGPVNLIGFGGGVDIFNSSVFKFTSEDGSAFVIDQRTGLQTVADTNNNTVTVSAAGITQVSGNIQTRGISFTRDSLGRISQITDPAGNVQSYTYDPQGDLASWTDNEGNTSTYTYDTTHRLLTIRDPRGLQPIRNEYDDDGRLIGHTDGFGKVITYAHDLSGRVETVTDRLGHSTSYEYDERGNVRRKTDARGGVTTFTYDANDNVLNETNALGKTTTYSYDPNDHRTSITDPLGNSTQLTYNELGKVLTTTDSLGHLTTNTYNASGNLLASKDALNNTTSFIYSVFDGQRISTTDALNNTTRYDYSDGYLTQETDALGNETTFTYDSNGNRASQTVKRTNPQGQLESITTNYEYDKLNRLKKTIFADGSSTQVEYNAIGQQDATIDQLGHRTELTYDDMGRLTRTDNPDGTHEDSTYDPEGRRLTSRDRAGHVTSYTYDELGRLTKTTYADGSFTSTTYDTAGEMLASTDARGNVTRYEYDDAGRRIKIRNALNEETTFAYDAGGNQLSMTDALGQTTTFEYDASNRRTKSVYADGTFASVAYDALGRTVSKTDQAGKTTQFAYDAGGRLQKVKDALSQETSYTYNELGQQTGQTDANNHTTRFEYDLLGRRIRRILPLGQFETYAYDAGGNLQNRTDFNGKTITFTYDLMRRLLAKTPEASLSQPPIAFSYNATGQRATMSDASGINTYSYDVRNRLAGKQTPFGTLRYTYDAGGNLQSTRSANVNGVSVHYTYDTLNRLATVRDDAIIALNGGTTTYNYDSVGNLQGSLYPNGVASRYAYNSLNRLTGLTVGTSSSSLAGYSYSLGPTGNRTAVTELSGRTVNYAYDDLYRLTGESIGNDPHGVAGSVSYSYDAVGNRLHRSSTLATLASQSASYDANDRLDADSYDNNGNTTAANGNSYAYDFENRLTSRNNGSVTYVYDGDGNRVGRTVAGITTNYLVDTNNSTGYAQVVEELQNGAVVRSFTYGHDLISQRIAGRSLSFYGYDGHGSVRLLTDAAAAVTDTYDYDAFGNLISRTGTTPNDYLYAGEQFDADLGFYYLRARYMNPVSGRFFSMDSFAGSTSDPSSLHKYLYANANPVTRVDPSGRFSLLNTVITSTSIGAVSGFGLGLLTGGLQGAVRGAIHGAIIGALIPLTGAGVGYALLGNAARGVFIVGWGVGLANGAVSGFSLATATTREERFDAGVSLLATVAFMFVAPKVLERVNTRLISGEEANADFLAKRGGLGEWPWDPAGNVTETTLFRAAKYVRVYLEGRNNPAGTWVMEASEIEGLSMSQIQQKFALPFTPSHITTVDVPAGTTIRIGTAGQNAFGPGGGLQVEMQRTN